MLIICQSFLPDVDYDKKENASEEAMLKLINEGRLEQALKVYKTLEENVSKDAKQSLLELLCFYNSTEDIPKEYLEERTFQDKLKTNKNDWM